ncbi:hypothetical protein JKP88DRAFT_180864 [Tribonema minus]|uniref:Uncharacterized protein n=1 Tax=Tribonema minus TaxID=303371 RepID=A0A835Z398_9STRA|nr:hypothetical protein JKP88DRAFT_180864 [Tribonema minus]
MVARQRLGVGFDPPGYEDAYADASAYRGESSRQQAKLAPPPDQTLSLTHTVRHVDFNPAAGTVRRHELAAPWMSATVALGQRTLMKSNVLIRDKRTLGLARQTTDGLDEGLGIKYDVTEMAILLRQAFDYRDMSAEEQAALSAVKRAEALEANVLDAALRYDIKQVARLLQLQLPSPKTFGEGVPL